MPTPGSVVIVREWQSVVYIDKNSTHLSWTTPPYPPSGFLGPSEVLCGFLWKEGPIGRDLRGHGCSSTPALFPGEICCSDLMACVPIMFQTLPKNQCICYRNRLFSRQTCTDTHEMSWLVQLSILLLSYRTITKQTADVFKHMHMLCTCLAKGWSSE